MTKLSIVAQAVLTSALQITGDLVNQSVCVQSQAILCCFALLTAAALVDICVTFRRGFMVELPLAAKLVEIAIAMRS